MGLLLLFGAAGSVVMWGTLLLALALTFWEVREAGFSPKASLWWLLLVLLAHVPAYLALRVVTAYLKKRETA